MSDALNAARQLRDDIAVSLRAVSWLVNHGLRPILQTSGDGRPWVMVAHDPHRVAVLKQLYEGRVVSRSRTPRGHLNRWEAHVDGCTVAWLEELTL
ncbi:hypothetical protein [Chitiniphilus eburneus]|uniref:hypothetical protein n=1 Tax=Chitiniphilus eburneus TaxID=2571148 RepID=UPI0035CF5C7D